VGGRVEEGSGSSCGEHVVRCGGGQRVSGREIQKETCVSGDVLLEQRGSEGMDLPRLRGVVLSTV
jgi:hypothetical protein